jgi:hypothetical protein
MASTKVGDKWQRLADAKTPRKGSRKEAEVGDLKKYIGIKFIMMLKHIAYGTT